MVRAPQRSGQPRPQQKDYPSQSLQHTCIPCLSLPRPKRYSLRPRGPGNKDHFVARSQRGVKLGGLGVGLPAKIRIQASSAPNPGHIPFRKGLGLVGGERGSQGMCRQESIRGRERALGSAFHRPQPQARLSLRSSASGLTSYSPAFPAKCAGCMEWPPVGYPCLPCSWGGHSTRPGQPIRGLVIVQG